MNLTTASRTFQLLTRILDTQSATEAFLPTAAEKPPLPLRAPLQPFPRATPESQGVSSRLLRRFLEELNRGRDLYMQDVMVLRSGRVICEAAFGSQDLRAAKYTFSACKSVVSLAVGLLADDGLLSVEEPVAADVPTVLELDLQGARRVKERARELGLDVVYVFLAPPSFDELKKRLIGRGTETPEQQAKRLETAKVELAAEPEFDVTIVNNTVEQAAEDLWNVIAAEYGLD